MNAKDIIREQISASAEIKQQLLSDNRVCDVIAKAAQICVEAYRNGKKTLFAGNGGSAAEPIPRYSPLSVMIMAMIVCLPDRFRRKVTRGMFSLEYPHQEIPRISLRHYQNVTVRAFIL